MGKHTVNEHTLHSTDMSMVELSASYAPPAQICIVVHAAMLVQSRFLYVPFLDFQMCLTLYSRHQLISKQHVACKELVACVAYYGKLKICAANVSSFAGSGFGDQKW